MAGVDSEWGGQREHGAAGEVAGRAERDVRGLGREAQQGARQAGVRVHADVHALRQEEGARAQGHDRVTW